MFSQTDRHVCAEKYLFNEILTRKVDVQHSHFFACFTGGEKDYIPRIGIQIRNMKRVFNIYGTWQRVMFKKLMMKIYDFFLFS